MMPAIAAAYQNLDHAQIPRATAAINIFQTRRRFHRDRSARGHPRTADRRALSRVVATR